MEKRPEEHDRIVLEGVRDLAERCDVVVFAQGSMARLKDSLEKDLKDKVLTSPESGVRKVREVLGL